MMNELWLWLITHTTDPMTLLVLGALSPHPMDRIVNVHWGGGLAVEFAKGST